VAKKQQARSPRLLRLAHLGADRGKILILYVIVDISIFLLTGLLILEFVLSISFHPCILSSVSAIVRENWQLGKSQGNIGDFEELRALTCLTA